MTIPLETDGTAWKKKKNQHVWKYFQDGKIMALLLFFFFPKLWQSWCIAVKLKEQIYVAIAKNELSERKGRTCGLESRSMGSWQSAEWPSGPAGASEPWPGSLPAAGVFLAFRSVSITERSINCSLTLRANGSLGWQISRLSVLQHNRASSALMSQVLLQIWICSSTSKTDTS